MTLLHWIVDYLSRLGWLSWALLIIELYFAIRDGRTRFHKILTASVVLAIFAVFPRRWAWHDQERADHLTKAQAMFKERC